MNPMKRVVGGAVLAAALATAIGAAAQAPPAAQAGFKRIPVQQGDLTISGREAVQAVAEVSPGSESGRHTHPGDEVAYILEGTVTVEMQGKPAVVKKAGEGLIIPAGTIHNARNTSKAVAKVLATYIIEKGKPVATPAQ
jgi:quercetin dioxygenase-like cupin family protein